MSIWARARAKIQQHKSISITQAYDWHGNDDEHGNGMKQAW